MPEWQSGAHVALEKFSQIYLEGDSHLAGRHFAEARMSISATGRLDLASRAELIRCGLATASLSNEPCVEFEALRGFASAQGFRRPLLAYLNVQAKLAEHAGDTSGTGNDPQAH